MMPVKITANVLMLLNVLAIFFILPIMDMEAMVKLML